MGRGAISEDFFYLLSFFSNSLDRFGLSGHCYIIKSNAHMAYFCLPTSAYFTIVHLPKCIRGYACC